MITLHLAQTASLVELGGRAAIFSESCQTLFELNSSAETAALRLTQGITYRGLVESLIAAGADEAPAAQSARDLLVRWSQAGLVSAEATPAAARAHHHIPLSIVGLRVDVHVDDPRCRDLITASFANLIRADGRAIAPYRIRDADGLALICRGGKPSRIVEWSQFVPTFKACLTDDVLHASPRIALHTACLMRDGRCLLLSGAPGAGKSTLTMALDRAGFGYAADDVTLLTERGRAQGLPFHPTLKAGAWTLLPDHRDEIDRAEVHDRLDGEQVRYPAPLSPARTEARPVGWIVLLRRADDAEPALVSVDPVQTLGELLHGAYSRSGRTSSRELRMLIEMVSSARCFALRYAHLEDAVELLDSACGRA